MEQASTATAFGHVTVLTTDGDTHPPSLWAEVTVGRIMALDDEISNERARLANSLRQGIKEILGDIFDKVRHLAMRTDDITPETIADTLTYKIGRAAQGTPWQYHFTHPDTKYMIWLELMRTLNTIIYEQRAHHMRKGN